MNPYEQKRRWKYFLLAFAVVIASGSVFYTSYLVKNIARSERTRAQVWALSMKQLANTYDNDFLSYVFAVRDSLVVPAILTNTKGEIQATRGLDTTKTYIKLDPQELKASKKTYDPRYFEDELAYMKSQHEPFKITMLNDTFLVYYKDSALLTQLKIFPYIQLSVIAIFLVVAYTAFSSSRRSEQNQVWVGLAKETAHQLGTPISSLMAWIELMKEKFNAENDPLMGEMENDVKRLEIVADRFSKIGSKPQLEEHSVYAVVKDFVDYFRVRVSNRITFEMTGNRRLIAGLNIPLFDWVLENLLKNAVNAIEGPGTIKVQIHGNKQKKLIFIDISDTGKGIPRSKFDTVFQPGYTTRQRGWGLGLSLTKRIIQNYHNGQIFVKDSEIGKGTTFRIVLKTIKYDKETRV
ncbi:MULTISPECIES: sensor histidine kinase [unclassified Mucilaginibacter]|uniref:sensor histidine kinase n=1 Tax=unclassified Mucilaginibacter TaxID=2617802 RepID=UPI00095C44B3|nr:MULTISPECIES: HAMP domain-containing sensor histidine kinase [unclassified Mucilaginibacter]OJW12609.1 MAG: sensor histidine kinase [Mucilaginibacter sp. 44-25]PLW90487.1 MAG: sensor histidine kinase [Mucilaginibacter sp.]HEK22131.1 HAMP domain-containing histidine kinase [Bacteroidota bacterium]